MSDIDILGTLAPNTGSTAPLTRAKYVANGYAIVADATARDSIPAPIKGGGFIVFRVDTQAEEYWNGLSWVAKPGGGGGSGGGRSYKYGYSATTTAGDPGPGLLRLSSATYSAVTSIYIDNVDNAGTSATAWLDSFDDYVGSVKGILRLQSISDATKVVEYAVTAVVDSTGYRTLTVVYLGGTGTLTTTAGDTNVSFDAIGVPSNLGNGALTGVKSVGYSGEVDNGNSGTADTIDFTTGDLQKSTLTGNVTYTFIAPAGVGHVQLRVIQDGTGGRTITFPGSVLGSPPQPAAAAGAVTFYVFFYDGTNYRYAPAGLPAGNAAGQELLFDGTAWYKVGRKTGSALGDASVTVQYTTAAQYIWPAATNTTANRNITLGTTGLSSAPNAGVGAILNFYLLKAGYAHNIAFINGGAGAGTKFTLPASYTNPIVVSFYYDGTNWELAGWEDLGTVTAV